MGNKQLVGKIGNSDLLTKGIFAGVVFSFGYIMLDPLANFIIDYINSQIDWRKKQKIPKRIILIRHGQSIGNVCEKIYEHTPDNKVGLSEMGFEQALKAGQELKKIIGEEKVKFYVSPFLRARQTFDNISKSFVKTHYIFEEDPRLREQEWGNFQNNEQYCKVKEDRRKVGRFYYRFHTGESGADVLDRVSLFLASFFRRIQTDEEKEYFRYQNVVLITHGLFIQLFLTKMLSWSVEEFDIMQNPFNCEIIIMEKDHTHNYQLKSNIRKNKSTVLKS